jgi:hypothetical protein
MYLGYQATIMTNSRGLNPYNQAVAVRNSKMVKFIFDAMVYCIFPYHTPTVMYALFVTSFVYLISHGNVLHYYVISHRYTIEFNML